MSYHEVPGGRDTIGKVTAFGISRVQRPDFSSAPDRYGRGIGAFGKAVPVFQGEKTRFLVKYDHPETTERHVAGLYPAVV